MRFAIMAIHVCKVINLLDFLLLLGITTAVLNFLFARLYTSNVSTHAAKEFNERSKPFADECARNDPLLQGMGI